jgi:hypothetical protein
MRSQSFCCLDWRRSSDGFRRYLLLQERSYAVGDLRLKPLEVTGRVGCILDDAPVLDVERKLVGKLIRADYNNVLAASDCEAKLVHHIRVPCPDVCKAECPRPNFFVESLNRYHGSVVTVNAIRLQSRRYNRRGNGILIPLIVRTLVKWLEDTTSSVHLTCPFQQIKQHRGALGQLSICALAIDPSLHLLIVSCAAGRIPTPVGKASELPAPWSFPGTLRPEGSPCQTTANESPSTNSVRKKAHKNCPPHRTCLNFAVALMQGNDPTPELEAIRQLPLEKRCVWRVASALKWGFADFDSLNVEADQQTLTPDDFAKVMELLKYRPIQSAFF